MTTSVERGHALHAWEHMIARATIRGNGSVDDTDEEKEVTTHIVALGSPSRRCKKGTDKA